MLLFYVCRSHIFAYWFDIPERILAVENCRRNTNKSKYEKTINSCAIPASAGEVGENCVLLGYYGASCGYLSSTFRDKLSVLLK